jgi:hypothetical protein
VTVPEAVRDVAVATPRTGVTSVGEVAKTRFPVPVKFVTLIVNIPVFTIGLLEEVVIVKILLNVASPARPTDVTPPPPGPVVYDRPVAPALTIAY